MVTRESLNKDVFSHPNSGLPSQAFEYIHYNPGLMQEKDYPYKAKVGLQGATNS